MITVSTNYINKSYQSYFNISTMSLIYNEHNEFFHLCQHVPGLWPVSAPMRPKNKPQIQWFYHQFPDEDSHEDSHLGVYPGIVGEKLEQTRFFFKQTHIVGEKEHLC